MIARQPHDPAPLEEIPSTRDDSVGAAIASLRRTAILRVFLRGYWTISIISDIAILLLFAFFPLPPGRQSQIGLCAVFVLIPMVASLIRCLATPQSDPLIAKLVDESLGLKERVFTALELSSQPRSAYTQLVAHDARNALRLADMRLVIGIKWDAAATFLMLALSLLLVTWHTPEVISSMMVHTGQGADQTVPLFGVQKVQPLVPPGEKLPTKTVKSQESNAEGEHPQQSSPPDHSSFSKPDSTPRQSESPKGASNQPASNAQQLSGSNSATQPQESGSSGQQSGSGGQHQEASGSNGGGSQPSSSQNGDKQGSSSNNDSDASNHHSDAAKSGGASLSRGNPQKPGSGNSATPHSRSQRTGQDGSGNSTNPGATGSGRGSGVGTKPGAEQSGQGSGKEGQSSSSQGSGSSNQDGQGNSPGNSPARDRSASSGDNGNTTGSGGPGAPTGEKMQNGTRVAKIGTPASMPAQTGIRYAFHLPKPGKGTTITDEHPGKQSRPASVSGSNVPFTSEQSSSQAAQVQRIEHDPDIPAGYRALIKQYFSTGIR